MMSGVRLQHNAAGLELLHVANERAEAVIALQGAQILHWAPRGASSVLWCTSDSHWLPGKAIRGGIPICWPWFAAHGSQPAFPSHGIARTAPWELDHSRLNSNGATQLLLRMKFSEPMQAWWPYPSDLELHATVGTQLELTLITRNRGNQPCSIGVALHSYFAVSDVRQIEIAGLEDSAYIDKTDHGVRKRQTGPCRIDGETDRIYQSDSACRINDPGGQRRIRIEKTGSRSTVVWNPWREKAAGLDDLGAEGYLHMVCVESGNVADDVLTLAPGEETQAMGAL
ncbi:MAG: D-hexose-6-phosphate mutarotase [Methylococcaceae bacterium]|nr:MAG: D-hexose-6-phosphate mutarotase [Methylococcaceae bacterium]